MLATSPLKDSFRTYAHPISDRNVTETLSAPELALDEKTGMEEPLGGQEEVSSTKEAESPIYECPRNYAWESNILVKKP